MKKVLVLSMALISAVSLTACGGGTAPTTAAATTGAATGAASSEAQEQGQDGGAAASGNWDNYELKLATNLAEDMWPARDITLLPRQWKRRRTDM